MILEINKNVVIEEMRNVLVNSAQGALLGGGLAALGDIGIENNIHDHNALVHDVENDTKSNPLHILDNAKKLSDLNSEGKVLQTAKNAMPMIGAGAAGVGATAGAALTKKKDN